VADESQEPTTPQQQFEEPDPPWWKRTAGLPLWGLVLIGVGLLAVGGLVGAIVKNSTDSESVSAGGATSTTQVAPPSTEQSTTTLATSTTQATTTTAATTTAATTTTLATTTVATTTTTIATTTTPSGPAVGTRENPFPLGAAVPAGDWTYQVVGFEPNVNAQVHAINSSNPQPPSGAQYARLRLRATYHGPGTGDPRSIEVNIVGPSNATYGRAPVSSGIGGDLQQITDQPAPPSGGAVEGYFYYVIKTSEAGAKLVGFDPNIHYSGVPGGVGFFAVS
jgi:hypothetical protein